MLSADVLAAARAELDAWQSARSARSQTRRQLAGVAARRARSCSCGCNGIEWNRTGMCQAEYSRRRRARERATIEQRQRVEQLTTPLLAGPALLVEPRPCRCGRPVVTHDRCARCYNAWRKTHPKRCSCGHYFKGRGTKCKRCLDDVRMQRLRQRVGPCACGRLAQYASGECKKCRALRQVAEGTRALCCCGRAPIECNETCMRCYHETYGTTPRGRWIDRTSQQKRRRARRGGTQRTHQRALTHDEVNARRKARRHADPVLAERIRAQQRESHARTSDKRRAS